MGWRRDWLLLVGLLGSLSGDGGGEMSGEGNSPGLRVGGVLKAAKGNCWDETLDGVFGDFDRIDAVLLRLAFLLDFRLKKFNEGMVF